MDATTLVDVLRGSLECPDFTEIVFILDLLQMLDVDLGQPKKAKEAGWDLNKFQIRIIYIKDRFTKPTSGGWADCMVNFSFAHVDETHHVMELQLQVLSPATCRLRCFACPYGADLGEKQFSLQTRNDEHNYRAINTANTHIPCNVSLTARADVGGAEGR